MIDASFVEKIAELSGSPVAVLDGMQFIKNGYTYEPTPTVELTALLNEQKAELLKLEHKLDLQKTELNFVELESFSKITTLSSLCDILKAEINREAAAFPYFVSVTEYNGVEVYGSYEADFSRRLLYAVKSDNHELEFGGGSRHQLDIESAIIALQTKFINSDDLPYVLDMCSKISVKSEVTTDDNGLSQEVTVNKGVKLVSKAQVKPRVTLRPFRTFIEVEQPASEYLLRFHDGGSISLTGADGGAWKLKAKASIAEFLSEQLADLIKSDKVKVLR